MTNAFDWRGKPSIFTTGRGAAEYTESLVIKHRNTSMRTKPQTVSLPGGSPYPAPKMDALVKGGERGRRTKVRDVE